MIQRCYQPRQSTYKDYGAIGIVTCDRWRDFRNFLEDMGERPQGTTLDRIDGALGYYKGNCRWATKVQQANNQKNNLRLEYQGKNQTVSEWAKELGLKKTTIAGRAHRGWPIELILSPILFKPIAHRSLKNGT